MEIWNLLVRVAVVSYDPVIDQLNVRLRPLDSIGKIMEIANWRGVSGTFGL